MFNGNLFLRCGVFPKGITNISIYRRKRKTKKVVVYVYQVKQKIEVPRIVIYYLIFFNGFLLGMEWNEIIKKEQV